MFDKKKLRWQKSYDLFLGNHFSFGVNERHLHLLLGLEDGDDISLLLHGAHDALRVVREHDFHADTDGAFVKEEKQPVRTVYSKGREKREKQLCSLSFIND